LPVQVAAIEFDHDGIKRSAILRECEWPIGEYFLSDSWRGSEDALPRGVGAPDEESEDLEQVLGIEETDGGWCTASGLPGYFGHVASFILAW
jgi:hypothetical protein